MKESKKQPLPEITINKLIEDNNLNESLEGLRDFELQHLTSYMNGGVDIRYFLIPSKYLNMLPYEDYYHRSKFIILIAVIELEISENLSIGTLAGKLNVNQSNRLFGRQAKKVMEEYELEKQRKDIARRIKIHVASYVQEQTR